MDRVWQTFFAKLAQVPTVHNARALEAKLEVGDIFVSSMAPPKNARSIQEKVFRSVSSGAQGDWTHTGLYVGDGKIVEMRDRMQTRSLPRAFKAVDAKFIRPNLPAAARAAAANKLLALSKSKKGRAARYATKGTLARALLEHKTPRKMLDDTKVRASNRYTCSHLVADSYAGAVDFADGKSDAGFVMPVDLDRSPKTRDVVIYRNRGRKDRK